MSDDHLPCDGHVRRRAEAFSNNLVLVVVFHALCIVLVGIPILIFFVAGRPFKRGFFCNDESLMYPFRESTVTSAMLYSYGLLIPLFLFLVVEFLRFRTKMPETLRLSSRYMGRWPVPAWVQVLYQVIGSFLFGACVSQLITDIAKYNIGRLRPHFFDLCKPSNLDLICGNNRHAYIEEFTCSSGASERLLKEVRLSFLSGHSSFSAYTMFFAALYLQARASWPGGVARIGRAVVQAYLILLAWYTALSRVSDYKHHWSDVLAGCVQGYITAILIVFGVSPLFNRRRITKDVESPGASSATRSFNTFQPEHPLTVPQNETAAKRQE